MSSGALLVTGGAGFIGTSLIRAMRRRDPSRQIVSIDRRPSLADIDVRWDITSDGPLPAVPELGYSSCIHLAAVAKEPGYPHEEYFRVNHLGTSRVLSLCTDLDIQSVVFTSTMMVFAAGPPRRTSTDPVCPDTAYGSSKALAEIELIGWRHSAPNRRATTIRPAVVFGPGDAGNYEHMRRALEKRRFAYIGRRDTVKSAVHIDDVVGLILHVIEAHETGAPVPSPIHCAIDAELTIEHIVRATNDAFGYNFNPPVIPYRPARAAAATIRAVTQDRWLSTVHPRRVEKLYHSTNLDASGVREAGYNFVHPTIEDACTAWALGLTSATEGAYTG